MRAPAAALVLVIAGALGCARPYAGPKTMAAIGAALLAGGAAAWAAGETKPKYERLAAPGFAITLVGAGLVIAGGSWLAAAVACEDDAGCPKGEECKEVPAPPGGVPYRQCVPR